MEKKKIFQFIALFISFMFLIVPVSSRGATEDAGGAGSFLYEGVGGRGLAMGKAYVSLVNDASAPYWNPAGLKGLPRRELFFQYARLFPDINFSYIGFGLPLAKYGSVGIGLVDLRTGFIKGTGETSSIGANVLLLSHGLKLVGNLWGGYNFKVVTQQIGDSTGVGWGMDSGLLYQQNFFGRGILNCGLNLKNILNPRVRAREAVEEYPLVLDIGAALRLFNDQFVVAFSVNQQEYRKPKYHCGLEGNFYLFSVRMGAVARGEEGIDIEEITFGMGVEKGNYRIDYACGQQPQGAKHRLSMGIRFGKEAD